MAYKYQPIKDEMFASDGEGDHEEQEEQEEVVEENGEGVVVENGEGVVVENGEGEHILSTVDAEGAVDIANLPPNAKVKQVIEQDGVLILETVEGDHAEIEGLPEGSTILAAGDTTLEMESSINESSMDDSAILAELDDSTVEVKPSPIAVAAAAGPKESCHICGKKVAALDKHILSEHGEKVECQLCNQTFPVGNLRWHILKEHCHNKVSVTLCYFQESVTMTNFLFR